MMSNDDVYAAGLLTRALDPATQPPEIQALMRAEVDLLHAAVRQGMRVRSLIGDCAIRPVAGIGRAVTF